jgi:hypothetical protein
MVVVSRQKDYIVNHNFIFKDFKVEFPVESLLHSLKNIDFWNLLSFLILKHYLSTEFGWSKCSQEIILLCHFSVPFFPIQMYV